MIKAFLSHSSSDKDRYVRIVANKLGDVCVYDEYTFESGMQSLEEIMSGLDSSQLFVVFLSEKALESDWVKKEIFLAHEKLKRKELDRIFPLLIDPKLSHIDNRIPQWMKDVYNLKYVSKPTISARRIQQRLREISWLHNPRLKERDAIFVGRNDIVKLVEERVDDFDLGPPTCFIASGLPRIGRSTFLRHALIKSNVAPQSYAFPSIEVLREESLEDFILKLFDLGFSQMQYPTNLMSIDIKQKVDIAVKIICEIQEAKEIILIHDVGCIVNYTRHLQPWFDEILRQTSKVQQPTFIISSKYRPAPESLRSRQFIFSIGVPELTYHERRGLFKRLLDFENIVMTRIDFSLFTGLFQGLPDQIRFACDLICDLGIPGAQKETYRITEFNTDKAAIILSKYSHQPKMLEFLYLLSEFEFISFNFLFSIVDETEYNALVDELVATSICDYVGIEKEYLRVNDAIRDYILRTQVSLPIHFRKKLDEHLDKFIESKDEEERDVSDVTYSIKEAIKAGRILREDFLIPSHFVKSMRDLYQERGHLNRVIELADKLLEKEHLFDKSVTQNVRYFLCLSLARKHDRRMLNEVQKIVGIEREFLLGFYYRLLGRYEDAIKRFKQCLEDPIVSTRAKRELVQVYLSIEDYDAASSLAHSNYEENRRNPYHIQSYFNTIINSRDAIEKRDLLFRLIQELEVINADIPKEMAKIASAEFAFKCDGHYQKAVDIINDAIAQFPKSHYLLLSKAFLAAKQHDLKNLKDSYERLEKMGKDRNISEDALVRLKSFILALEGDLPKALEYAESNLKRCPEYSRTSFMQKLRELSRDHERS